MNLKNFWIILLTIVCALLITGMYFLLIGNMRLSNTNNERFDKLEQKMDNLIVEVSVLKSIRDFSQKIQDSTAMNTTTESNNKDNSDNTKNKELNNIGDQNISFDSGSVEQNKIEPIKINYIGNKKELGYIKNIYSDSLGREKIDVDYIELLPAEECLPALICFKNDSRRTESLFVAADVEINIYTTSYILNGNDGSNITFENLQQIFNPDFPKESNEYNQFKEIPYWMTIKNGKIKIIEEQEIAGFYK